MGKGYLVDGLFKANVAMVDKKSVYLYPKLINKEKSSVYLLESPTLLHARLGHVNYKSLKNLSNLGYIPKLNLEEICKCEIYIEAMNMFITFKTEVENQLNKNIKILKSDEAENMNQMILVSYVLNLV